jgi:hypothetical protein
VKGGLITDPARVATIMMGQSILHPEDSFDSENSDNYYDAENDEQINQLVIEHL